MQINIWREVLNTDIQEAGKIVKAVRKQRSGNSTSASSLCGGNIMTKSLLCLRFWMPLQRSDSWYVCWKSLIIPELQWKCHIITKKKKLPSIIPQHFHLFLLFVSHWKRNHSNVFTREQLMLWKRKPATEKVARSINIFQQLCAPQCHYLKIVLHKY